jgi:hypothetical protein
MGSGTALTLVRVAVVVGGGEGDPPARVWCARPL